MLKLELSHDFADKSYSKMVERDYSNLREVKRDVVVTEYEYQGEKKSYSKTYVTFGGGLTLEYKSTYLGDGDSVGSVAVWDPIKKEPVWFGLGYEAMAPNRNENIAFDATPEVKAEYEAYKKAQEDERKRKEAEHEAQVKAEAAAFMATQPTKGKTVRVVRGRKIPIGTVGKVFWYGTVAANYSGSRWSRGTTQTRVGLEVVDEITGTMKLFTATDNVEIVEG